MDRRLRAGRGTNLALLALLGSALGTGALAFANGGRWAFAALAAHGAAGLGIVLLSPWKSAIAGRASPCTFCDFAEGAMCGATDKTGTCKARPSNCPLSCPAPQFRPCGCDGQLYCSACDAQHAGVAVSGQVGTCD